MIEQQAVAGKHPVPLPVVHHHPIGIDLGSGIRALRPESSRFILWRWCGAKHFATRGLIEFCLDATATYRRQETCGPQARYIASVFGRVKAHSDVALCPQMIDLVRLHIVNEGGLLGIRQVAIVQKESGAWVMWILIEMVDTGGIKRAGPADQTVDLIAF
jgi:hypothetical protein